MLDRYVAKLFSRAFLCFVFSIGVHGFILHSTLSVPEPPVSAPIIGKPEPFKLQLSYYMPRPKPVAVQPAKLVEDVKKETVKAKVAKPKKQQTKKEVIPQKAQAVAQNASDKVGEKANEVDPKIRAQPILYKGNRLEPVYPLSMAKLSIEGFVCLVCLIDSSGRATQIEVLSSSGYQAFEKSCIATLKKESFGPEWIGQRVEVPYYFKMRSQNG